ncbi:MAG TPA: hypothetical protein VKU41_18860 [Polyangiaceae bacterium]|nr:hypothetical protein [Polyangiaceae bacterium]
MKTTIAAILGACVATWSTLDSNVAHACGFLAYREETPFRPAPARVRLPPTAPPVVMAPGELISSAEQRLEEEHFAAAAAAVLSAFPRLASTTDGASPLETRAQRILVLAVARSDGALTGVSAFGDKGKEARASHLEWAIATMRVLESIHGNDPVAQGDLGETLAKLPKYEDEALGILAPLAERDLLGSAHAYATLARLRVARSEGAGGDEDIRRCRRMTKLPDAVCGAGPHPPGDAKVASRS